MEVGECLIFDFDGSTSFAGLPMQLTFFVHPYEVKNALTSSEIGVSMGVAGKVTMEKSSQLFMLSTDPNLFE